MTRKEKCLCGTTFEVPVQPEPACFVAPLELDGDPPRSPVSLGFLMALVVAVVALGALALAAGCAPSSAYQPPATYKACSVACERLGCARHEREAVCDPLRRLPV